MECFDGLKCPNLIWYRLNVKDDISSMDVGTQSIFNCGHWVGEKAKVLLPNGVEDSGEIIWTARGGF